MKYEQKSAPVWFIVVWTGITFALGFGVGIIMG